MSADEWKILRAVLIQIIKNQDHMICDPVMTTGEIDELLSGNLKVLRLLGETNGT